MAMPAMRAQVPIHPLEDQETNARKARSCLSAKNDFRVKKIISGGQTGVDIGYCFRVRELGFVKLILDRF